MKPDWKDAPEWAEWLALDGRGEWCWHEKAPSISTFRQVWFNDGEKEFAATDLSEQDWKESLERRP